jgi:hypothetical protein
LAPAANPSTSRISSFSTVGTNAALPPPACRLTAKRLQSSALSNPSTT